MTRSSRDCVVVLIGLGWVALCTAVFAVWRREEGRPVHVMEEGIGR